MLASFIHTGLFANVDPEGLHAFEAVAGEAIANQIDNGIFKLTEEEKEKHLPSWVKKHLGATSKC